MAKEQLDVEDYLPFVGQALTGILANPAWNPRIASDREIDELGAIAVKAANAAIKHVGEYLKDQPKRKLNVFV